MDKHEVVLAEGQSDRPFDSPSPQEKDFSTEQAELATAPRHGEDLINQTQHEDLEPVLHWR